MKRKRATQKIPVLASFASAAAPKIPSLSAAARALVQFQPRVLAVSSAAAADDASAAAAAAAAASATTAAAADYVLRQRAAETSQQSADLQVATRTFVLVLATLACQGAAEFHTPANHLCDNITRHKQRMEENMGGWGMWRGGG